MKSTLILLGSLLLSSGSFGQSAAPPKTKIMTLGVFHFDYPNLDVIKTDEKDQISVLHEPYQSQIQAICRAIEEYKPSIITVEQTPANQHRIDSLYSLFKAGKWELQRNEIYQLGFRIGKQLDRSKIYCVDDPGRHYESIEALFKDSVRMSRFERYYVHERDTTYDLSAPTTKVTNIIDALYESNTPDRIRDRLAIYLLHPFKYEEQPGDFTGVDFETGRWYNRNLRIFRNIQRIPRRADDRILLIIGSEHLNLLNLFFEISREFEFVSPLPYLQKAKSR